MRTLLRPLARLPATPADPRVRALLAAWLAAAACTTTEPRDPLDPSVILDAAEAEGDARGDDRSGRYDITVDTTAACDCPAVAGMDLCNNELTKLAFAGGAVTLTQSDGYLVLSEDSALLSLTGALDADGDFDLAGIYGFAGVFGDISVYVHLIGDFDGADRFSATLHSRAQGDYNSEAIDCRTEVPLYGVRGST